MLKCHLIMKSLLSGASSVTEFNVNSHCIQFYVCLLQFHVTPRLKAHTTQRLLNNFTSLNSTKVAPVDKERPKKDPGLPPVHGQVDHSLNNGQETDNTYNRQVCNLERKNY